jgi:hypothetical protein
VTPTHLFKKYCIRFCVTHEHATEKDIEFGWNMIKSMAEQIYNKSLVLTRARAYVPPKHQQLADFAEPLAGFEGTIYESDDDEIEEFSDDPDKPKPTENVAFVDAASPELEGAIIFKDTGVIEYAKIDETASENNEVPDSTTAPENVAPAN